MSDSYVLTPSTDAPEISVPWSDTAIPWQHVEAYRESFHRRFTVGQNGIQFGAIVSAVVDDNGFNSGAVADVVERIGVEDE